FPKQESGRRRTRGVPALGPPLRLTAVRGRAVQGDYLLNDPSGGAADPDGSVQVELVGHSERLIKRRHDPVRRSAQGAQKTLPEQKRKNEHAVREAVGKLAQEGQTGAPFVSRNREEQKAGLSTLFEKHFGGPRENVVPFLSRIVAASHDEPRS